jgi:hypothetical protein
MSKIKMRWKKQTQNPERSKTGKPTWKGLKNHTEEVAIDEANTITSIIAEE